MIDLLELYQGEGLLVSVDKEIIAEGCSPIFDRSNKNWFPDLEYNARFINATIQYMRDTLRARGHVLLNDVYDALGIPRTAVGAVLGWIEDDGILIKASIVNEGQGIQLNFKPSGIILGSL